MAESAEDTLRVACPVLGNVPARANLHAHRRFVDGIADMSNSWIIARPIRHSLCDGAQQNRPPKKKENMRSLCTADCGSSDLVHACQCSEMLCDSHVVSENSKFSDCSIKVFQGCLTINLPRFP